MDIKWVPDKTGRFPQRPHYTEPTLDAECERVLEEFFVGRFGSIPLPIPTDELTKLIERDARYLDLYADLSSEGDGVQGLTTFDPGNKPSVSIAAELTNDPRRENRLRTTLTHEFGHVHFHTFLFSMERSVPMFDEENEPWKQQLARVQPHEPPAAQRKCRRDSIVNPDAYDWMEWQAAYACGALLMPASKLTRIANEARVKAGAYGPLQSSSPAAMELVAATMKTFGVSEEAARVRLSKRGAITPEPVPPSLDL